MSVTPVATLSFGIYSTPTYAARLPAKPAACHAQMIDLTPPLDQSAHARAAHAAGFVMSRISASSFPAQLELVRNGYGAAVLPDLMASGLIQPFGRIDLPPLDVFLVTRPQALRQPHIRACFDILRATIQNTASAGTSADEHRKPE